MRITTRAHRKARIEIVPLIDVVFFLLATFVMVSLSMTRSQGMQVQLPSASTSQVQDSTDKALTLTVMETGEIYYNKEKITPAQHAEGAHHPGYRSEQTEQRGHGDDCVQDGDAALEAHQLLRRRAHQGVGQ